MPINLKKKPVTGSVKVDHTKGVGDDKTTETKVDKQVDLDPVKVPEQHALVEFSASMTKNLGNYESAKVHVGLTMPCDPEAIDEAFDYVAGWVNAKLEAVLEGGE